jgi:hypothetical protein
MIKLALFQKYFYCAGIFLKTCCLRIMKREVPISVSTFQRMEMKERRLKIERRENRQAIPTLLDLTGL